MQRKGMNNKRIELSQKHKADLAVEFNTTKQTIRMSLQYVFNSDQAIQIRERAKEMLQSELDSIKEATSTNV